MVEDFEKAGRGRSASGAAQLSFDTALKAWRLATEDKKMEAALAVLANAGSDKFGCATKQRYRGCRSFVDSDFAK